MTPRKMKMLNRSMRGTIISKDAANYDFQIDAALPLTNH
jgi:hypothetical protein